MRVLVTGAKGKVGTALVPALMEAGHEGRATDLARGVFDRPLPGDPEEYVQADLTDAGYALSKWFGELLMDAAVRRSDIRCISIRPCWVQNEANYERNLGPQVRDPAVLSANFWSYIDVYDLADAIVLAVESELPGHEVFYIASPDNVGGRPFAELVERYYGDA